MKKILIFVIVALMALSLCLTVSASSDPTEEQVTWFGRCVEWCGDNISEIFSAFSAVFSVIVMYLYRKNLIPTLTGFFSNFTANTKDGLKTVNDIVDALKKSSDENLIAIADKLTPIIENTTKATDAVEEATQRMNDLEEKLKSEQDEKKKLQIILSGQMDMFYNFFMAANLPQYQKDQLGETYANFKKMIGNEKE